VRGVAPRPASGRFDALALGKLWRLNSQKLRRSRSNCRLELRDELLQQALAQDQSSLS
jgi:hypothetical protein